MPQYDTTGYLLPAVRQRAFVPSSNATFKPPDVLRMMTEVLLSRVVPELLKVREEYYVQETDVPFSIGVSDYQIPARALGGELRDVLVVGTNGITRNLDEMDPETQVGSNTATGSPSSFTMRDNYVRVNPIPSALGESLRFVYHRWPPELVETAAAALVTGVAGNVATCAGGVPGGFSTSTLLDAIAGLPPFVHRAIDVFPTAVTGTTVTFSALPTGLVKGDYICLANEAPVAQIPRALYPLLVEACASEQMRAVGDLSRASASDTLFEVKKKAALSVIGKRVKGEVRRMTNGMDKWRGPVWKPGGWMY